MTELQADLIHKRKEQILAHIKMGSQHYLEAGIYMQEAIEAKDHKALGHTEEEYFIDCLGMKPSTCYNLIGIAKDFLFYISEDNRLLGCDYTRLVALRPVVKNKKPDEIREWLHKALTLPPSAFDTAIRATKTGIEPEDCEHEDTYTVTICRVCGYRRKE